MPNHKAKTAKPDKSPNHTPANHHAKSQLQIEKELIKEVKILSKEVQKIKDMEFIQILKHPVKLMGMSLLKGMMVGLGSVLGATVLVALLIYVLSKISLVPYIGDFVQDVVQQVQQVEPKEQEKTPD